MQVSPYLTRMKVGDTIPLCFYEAHYLFSDQNEKKATQAEIFYDPDSADDLDDEDPDEDLDI